jgi:hemerythrin superfamily protein
VHTLVGHEVAEEEIVYPAVRRMIDGGDALADARIAEQQKAEETLSAMERMDASTAEFKTRFQELKKEVLRHAEAEEREVFSKLKTAGDIDELTKLGKAYEAAKATAPTHPHPHAPNTPPGNLLLGPVAAIIDRARDAARGAMEKARS